MREDDAVKKILIILVLVVLLVVGLIVGAVAYGISQIDSIFERAIEQGGTYATGVETTVESVDVGLTTGTFEMTGLEIGNPEGFDSPHFLALGEGSVGVALSQATMQSIRVPEFRLSDIDLNLDQTGGKANYQTILDNLKRFESGSDGSAPESETTGPKVTIDKLTIENINVHLIGVPGLSLVAGDVAVNVPLIELTDVGGADGMSFGELTNLVVKTVLTAVVDAGGGVIPGEILGQLTGGLGELTSLGEMGVNIVGGLGEGLIEGVGTLGEGAAGAVGDVAEGAAGAVGDVVEGAGETVKDAVGGLGEGLGNILGGGDDKDDDGGP